MRFEPALTPGQDATLRRDTAMRAAMKLSAHDVAILRHGARNRDGIISKPMKASNFDKPEKRMAKLVAAGLAIPNAHGDWYITDFGRAVLSNL